MEDFRWELFPNVASEPIVRYRLLGRASIQAGYRFVFVLLPSGRHRALALADLYHASATSGQLATGRNPQTRPAVGKPSRAPGHLNPPVRNPGA